MKGEMEGEMEGEEGEMEIMEEANPLYDATSMAPRW